jgi:hypothetical protein
LVQSGRSFLRTGCGVRTAAAGLGSEPIAAALERDLLAIDEFDAEVWTKDDELGHTISSALHQLKRRLPTLGDDLIERLLRSKRYNIAMYAVRALGDRGDELALRRLIDLHRAKRECGLRDLAAQPPIKIEQLAARLQIVVRKTGRTTASTEIDRALLWARISEVRLRSNAAHGVLQCLGGPMIRISRSPTSTRLTMLRT